MPAVTERQHAGESPGRPAGKDLMAANSAAIARMKAVAKAVETTDACKGKAAAALSMLADDDFANLSAGALVKMIGLAPAPDSGENAEDAARSEMRAAIAETTNSDIEPHGGGGADKASKAKAASEAWSKVYAELSGNNAR